MATITQDQGDGPGKGGERVVKSRSKRQLLFITGTFDFDNSYPTGGESLAAVFDQFTSPLGMLIEQPIIAGAQTGKFIKVNMTTEKVQLFTNASPFAEVANASDQSAITGLRFVAYGYR